MLRRINPAWLNLAAGLIFLAKIARDHWTPAFLSLTGHHDGNSSLEAVIGASFVIVACIQFMRTRLATR